MASDREVILKSLTREREELHEQLMQMDRIIKRVKGSNYSNGEAAPILTAPVKQLAADNTPITLSATPQPVDIRIAILRVFDLLGKASKLKEIQEEYNKVSGHPYNIRENVRSLYKALLLKEMKDRTVPRSVYWVKADWIEHGQLGDNYKPTGFDLFHKSENIYFE